MSNAQFGWDDMTAFEASMAKYHADKATAAVETYGEFIATISTAEEVVEESTTQESTTQDFATMTTAELREYAETVQAEYDADELTGAMGRQIVRDAWARVEAAEAAGAQWTADQHTANQMAAVEIRTVDDVDTSYDDEEIDEALDAIREAVSAGEGYVHLVAKAEGLGVSRFVISDVIATAKAESEVVAAEATTTPTAAEVVATINTNEAFGVAWGADGQVLTHAETCEAIAAGRGWFDRQGRWVNRAGWERKTAATIASK